MIASGRKQPIANPRERPLQTRTSSFPHCRLRLRIQQVRQPSLPARSLLQPAVQPLSSPSLMPSPRTLSALLLLLSATTAPCTLASDRSATARSNNASTQLIETASQQYADGHPDQAAATLERALHIQPNNPATLHYLGVLRLQQGQFQQAETLAARSNLRVGANQALRNRNLQLIAAAQTAQRTGVVPTRLVTVPVQDAIATRPSAPPLQPVTALGSEPNEIPRGLRPPPGKCRIWFPDRPPGHQPAPVKCKKLKSRVPLGAYLVRH